MPEPNVRLVYERTSPPGVDSGVEPLIAVCATEEAAEQIREESFSRGRYASWEELPLRGAADRTGPLPEGEIVHVVLLGGVQVIDPEGITSRGPDGLATFDWNTVVTEFPQLF